MYIYSRTFVTCMHILVNKSLSNAFLTYTYCF